MAESTAPLRFHLSAGTPTAGLWCDVCALSTAFEWEVFHLAEDGPRRIGTMRRCLTCDPDGAPPARA